MAAATATASPSTKMAEVAFAKQFLGALDRVAPIRTADFVKDQKKYPARPPTLLPPLQEVNPLGASAARSFSASESAAGRQQQQQLDDGTIAVTLTSLKAPKATHHLGCLAATTSVLELKRSLACVLSRAGTAVANPPAAIRLLHRRKPVADSKILSDLVQGGGAAAAGGREPPNPPLALEMSYMVARDEAAGEKGSAGAAAGDAQTKDARVPKRKKVKTDEFWHDLRGFLVQRLGDEAEASDMLAVFKSAVAKRHVAR